MGEENSLMYVFIFIVGGVIIIFGLINLLNGLQFRRNLKKDINDLLKNTRPYTQNYVTEEEVLQLPEPVQKFLRYSQVIGKKKAENVRIEQKGILQSRKKKKWYPFQAIQYFSTYPPSFIWYAKMQSFKASDRFIKGDSHLLTKTLGFRKPFTIQGTEVDQANLTRFLAEMMWFPTAFVNDYIQWEAIDKTSAQATIRLDELEATGTFYFDQEGKITEFRAKRHYTDLKGNHSLEDWSILVGKYREVRGLTIPAEIKSVWDFEDRQYTYFEGAVTNIRFDEKEGSLATKG